MKQGGAGSQGGDLGVVPALQGQRAPRLDLRAPVEVAKARAQEWLDALGPQGLVLEISERRPGRGFLSSTYCGFSGGPVCLPDGAFSAFAYASGGRETERFAADRIRIDIGFSQVISPGTPLDVVRRSFEWIALNRVPPGSLRVPGWAIIPTTRISSFHEGVEIISFADRRISLRARGQFFRLYGHKEGRDCVPPADAPTRPECYFSLEKDFPFDITIDLPIFPAA